MSGMVLGRAPSLAGLTRSHNSGDDCGDGVLAAWVVRLVLAFQGKCHVDVPLQKK